MNQECNEEKKISIVGTNNRYMMKKILHETKVVKKREESKKWGIPDDQFHHENQLKFLHEIFNNNFTHSNSITEVIKKEINKKISGYKQQDLLKKVYNEAEFLDFENVITKLVDSELKCYYCKCEILILYDIVRETKQWSIDRINNDIGHNKTNFHISCLHCNLKRRKKTDVNFLFTQQLNIVKKDNEQLL
jgi:hypothetical protein